MIRVRLFPTVGLLMLGPAGASFAQVMAAPSVMSFQGRLARSDGTPVPDGAYAVAFRLFGAPTGGVALWSHSVPVTVRDGTFSAILGGTAGTQSGPLASPLFAADRWLEIQLEGDLPLTPRQQIVSVAYAIKADSVRDGAISAGQLAPGLLNPLVWQLNGNSGVTKGFLGTTDSQPLAFGTGGTEKMRLLGNGNLGIGTSNPPQKLTVAGGNIQVDSGRVLGFSPADVFAYDGDIVGHYALGWYPDGSSSEGNTAWLTGYGGIKLFTAGAPRMTIDTVGNVGIGTTSPSARLHVGGPIAGPLVFAVNTLTNGIGVVGLTTGAESKAIWGQSALGWGIHSSGKAGGSSGWQTVSDARYKQRVATLEDSLDTILRLRGVSFDWNRQGYPEMNFMEGRQVGFIAQEVEAILPAIVSTDGKGYKSVIYANVVPVLVEATKQLHQHLEGQQNQIDALKAENARLRSLLGSALSRLERLEDVTGTSAPQ